MNDKILMSIGLGLILVAVSLAPPAGASVSGTCGTSLHPGNCYVSGYFINSQATATKAFFMTNFQGTNVQVLLPPKQNPAPFLYSLISIIGQYTGGNCPCLYQNTYYLYNTGSTDGVVLWIPQIFGTSGNLCCGGSTSIGATNASYYLGGLIKYDSSTSKVEFVAFVYLTLQQYQHNIPYIYTTEYSTGDTNFYYGTTTSNGYLLKRFQFGVESNYNLSGFSTKYQVAQNNIEVYASSWLYQAADGLQGNVAWGSVVCNPTCNPSRVGGWGMSNTQPGYVVSDGYDWVYSSTTESTGATIWTGTGGFTPYACQSSQGC